MVGLNGDLIDGLALFLESGLREGEDFGFDIIIIAEPYPFLIHHHKK